MDLGANVRVIGQRIIVASPLDHEAATLLCAELMTLDGRSADAVDLLVSSNGGPLDCLLPIADTINTMRAPVNTRATGVASGTAGVLVALGTGSRTAAAHALMSIRIEPLAASPGLAAERLAALAASHQRQLDAIATLLVSRTDTSASSIKAELRAGDLHAPGPAISLGLVDPPPA